MTVFDLLFLAAALLFLITLVVAAILALFRKRRQAVRLIGALGLFAVTYFVVSVGVAFFTPQRVLAADRPWCFDDWCLAVNGMTDHHDGQQVLYTVDLRIFSRAHRIAQRARGAWVYLVDAAGRRYAPTPSANEVPLDVLLRPLESRSTTRTFAVPVGVRPIGLITGHGGGYCGVMNLLIIGNGGCLFGKPTMVAVDSLRPPTSGAHAR